MTWRAPTAGALMPAMVVGATMWLSLGVLTVTGPELARVGALPPLWLLVTALLAAAALAWAIKLQLTEAWPLTLLLVLWVPWLPLRLTPALLVWDGPVEALIWSAALAGLAASIWVVRSWQRLPVLASPTHAPWIAAVAFAVVALIAGGRLQAWLPGGDEPHYLIMTQSLLYDGDLQIENNHVRGDYREYVDVDIPPHSLRRGANGEIYSVHAPGISLLVLPSFALGGYPAVVFTIALLMATAVACLWRCAYWVTESAAAAWAATLALAGSATFFFHSFAIFPDPFGAVIMTAVLAALATLDVHRATPRAVPLAALGAGLALLPWIHTRFAVVAGLAGVVLIARVWSFPNRLRAIAAFLFVPFVSAAAWFTFFHVIYGVPNPLAPYGGSRQTAPEWIGNGLAGLAFDQQFGLVTNAPVFALLPFGVYALARRRPRLAAELAVISTPYVVLVAAFAMWWGGWAAPARFLVVLTPFAILLFAAAWQWGGTLLRTTFVALTFLSIANTVARVALRGGALLYNARDGIDLLLEQVSTSVNVALAMPSLHRLGAEPTLLLASIWIVAFSACLLLTRLLPQRASLAVRWTVTSWALVLAISVALTASWFATRAQALRGPASQLEFVRQWDADARPLVVSLPDLRVTAPDSAIDGILTHTLPREWHRAATNGSVPREIARTARYGDVSVFALDSNAYVEPGGIWTRGDDVAVLAVAVDGESSVDLRVSAGPVVTGVQIHTGSNVHELQLMSGESRTLRVSAGRWRVRTTGRFRPVDHEPAQEDARPLGARLEFQ